MPVYLNTAMRMRGILSFQSRVWGSEPCSWSQQTDLGPVFPLRSRDALGKLLPLSKF